MVNDERAYQFWEGRVSINGSAGNDVLTAEIERLTTDGSGNQISDGSSNGVLSPDGKTLVFMSLASNLVANDTNGRWDLFFKDLETGQITRLMAPDGNQPNNSLAGPSFSPDGGTFYFAGYASNLVSGDTNGELDFFAKDLATGTITRLATGSNGEQITWGIATPWATADGAHLFFTSYSEDLVGTDSNSNLDLFVKDLATGQVTIVSRTSGGVQPTDLFGWGASADGRFVVLEAGDSFHGGSYGVSSLYLKDMSTGSIRTISRSEFDSSGSAQISADGSLVAYIGWGNDVVGDDNNGVADIFVYNRLTGLTTRVSVTQDGTEANGASNTPFFSPDGSRIFFFSTATNLDDQGRRGLFMKDLVTGELTFLAASPTWNNMPTFSADGRWIILSTSVALVAGDTNGQADVYRIPLPGPLSLDGGDGDDILNGGASGDYLRGGPGDDQMFGGLGDDTYVVDSIGDVADETGGDGVDLVISHVEWTLGAGFENLTLTPSARAVNGYGNSLNNLINGNASDNQLHGLEGDDTIYGNGGVDALYGGDGADVLDGGQGNDELRGESGDDTLSGDIGNDTLIGGTGADRMIGGAGHDTYYVDNSGDTVVESLAGAAGGAQDMVFSSVDFTLGANVEWLTITGSTGRTGIGNALKNVMTGGDGADLLIGGEETDTLMGGEGDDVLDGGIGGDILDGQGGDDTLYGGAGADSLTGGAGADWFVFSGPDISGPALQTDRIVDLSFAEGDRVDLSLIDADTGSAGNQSFVWAAKFTKVAGQAVAKYANGATTVDLDVNGDGRVDFRIAIDGDHLASTGANGNLYQGAFDTDGGWIL